jgi:phospholipid/cholesterol/gamma-HCH transport system substrate-binding protein
MGTMRATNLVIGTTTLAVLAAGFVGMLVVQKVRALRNQSPIRIVFDGSASGLRKGGALNFDGVPAGQILSIKLENPRKIVVMAMLDNSAPIRKDTVVGIEFQGLTGVAAISLVGGAPSAPAVPLDADGVPVLTADLREQQESVVDTLHRVDSFLIENRESIKDTMLSAESYTASLKSKADAIESILGKADSAFAAFDSGMDRITNALPGFADGKAEELFEKMKSLRELADTYKKKADSFMDDGRKMLSDLSESANNMTRKIDPAALPPPAPPRRPQQKRQ